MSKRKQDSKRQLFRGFTSKKSSSLDTATQNLLSRTLRKQSDKYKKPDESPLNEFVIHKTTSPDDYKIFSSNHPLRESKLQALEQSEQAFQELFHRHGFLEDSGSEDDEPDISSIASPSAIYEDDILVSVPGYSKEEITAGKRLGINDRKNVRLSKVSNLERAFSSGEFLKSFSHERLQEYNELNQEFITYLERLKEERDTRLQEENALHQDDSDVTEIRPYELESLKEAVNSLKNDAWMFHKRPVK